MTHITYILKHQHQQVQSIFQNNYSREIRHKDDETSSKRVDTKSKKGKEMGCNLGNTRTSGKSCYLETRGERVEETKYALFCDSRVGNFPNGLKRFGKEVDAWIQIMSSSR